jgi:hypothetical protein
MDPKQKLWKNTSKKYREKNEKSLDEEKRV